MIIDPDLRAAHEEYQRLHASLEGVRYDVTALGDAAIPTLKSLCATVGALFECISNLNPTTE